MEKIVRLLNILDDPIADKLVMLDRLVKLYAKFLKTWQMAYVTSDGTIVRVRFNYIDKYGYQSFTEREFPMEDVDKRIASYKRKIKKEFANRHDNVRIQREKEIRKWQKHIENADIQM